MQLCESFTICSCKLQRIADEPRVASCYQQAKAQDNRNPYYRYENLLDRLFLPHMEYIVTIVV